MRRKLFFFFWLYIGIDVLAIPAYPSRIHVDVNGKTVCIRLFGDENCKRAETEDGYAIVQKEDQQWCYAIQQPDMSLAASRWVVGSGVKSLQLSARTSHDDVTRILEFDCAPSHQGSMRIKICTTSLHQRFNKSNYVSIGWQTKDSPDWQYQEVRSALNNHWWLSFVDLPANASPHFRIIGVAYAGSILAIDNLKVEQEVADEEETVGSAAWQEIPELPIYNIFGMRVYMPARGLHIVRKVGSYKKLWICK